MRNNVPNLSVTLLSLWALAACSDARGQGWGSDMPENAYGDAKYPNLSVNGFADINFSDRSDDTGDSSNFSQGQLTLHVTSPLSEYLTFFSEVTLSASPNAATDVHHDSYRVEVERAVIKYTHSDQLQLSAGRYHTPLNYWNRTYHHGMWLQTPVSRPDMASFHGGFIPIHFEGALAEGSQAFGFGRLGYTLGFGNGRSEVITRAGDSVDVNENRAWLAGVSARPRAPGDLELGVSTYVDKISRSEDGAVDEVIYDAFLVWNIQGFELYAEFAEVQHESSDGDAQDTDSSGYAAMLGYTLPIHDEKFTPYVRFDDVAPHDDDPVFEGLSDVSGVTVGLRMDLAELLALKLEYRDLDDDADGDVTTYQAQLAFTF